MALPEFRAASQPEWIGRLYDTDTDWTGEDPVLVGRPNCPLPHYSLYLQPFGTSGAHGAYFRFFWIDRNLYPSTGALSVDDCILCGEHDINERWNGESPLDVGFGVAVSIASGSAFTAAGADSLEWWFHGYRELVDWAEINLQSNGENPVVVVSSCGPTRVPLVAANGNRGELRGVQRLSLGIPGDVVSSVVRGNITLAEMMRRPVVFLPEFDYSTVLSVPLTKCSEPDIGPRPKPRTSDGGQLCRYVPGGQVLQSSVLTAGDRIDRSGDLSAVLIEPESENVFDYSSPLGSGAAVAGSHGWTLPSGSGHETDIISREEYYQTPVESAGGVLIWRKGSDSQKLEYTATGAAASGETWGFSAYVRGGVAVGTGSVTAEITGTDTTEEEVELSGSWVRIRAWGVQTGANVTVSLDLSNEGEVMMVCGYQLERVGDGGRGAPSTLIPADDVTPATRAPGTYKYQRAWPADQGTFVCVFRFAERGGEGDTMVSVLSGYDTVAAEHPIMLVYQAGTSGTTRTAGILLDDGATLIAVRGLTIADGEIVHLAARFTPADGGSDVEVDSAVFVNGTKAISNAVPFLEGVSTLGDEIHVGPEDDMPSYGGQVVVPHAGAVELVRVDSRVWTDAEIERHAEKWTSDIGRDLVFLTQGRRFDLRTPYEQVPGAAEYTMTGLKFRQVGELPAATSPSRSFMTE